MDEHDIGRTWTKFLRHAECLRNGRTGVDLGLERVMRVILLDVPVQPVLLGEPSRAHRALDFRFRRVAPHVQLEVPLLAEAHGADLAAEGALTRVRALVRHQVGAVLGAVGAVLAGQAAVVVTVLPAPPKLLQLYRWRHRHHWGRGIQSGGRRWGGHCCTTQGQIFKRLIFKRLAPKRTWFLLQTSSTAYSGQLKGKGLSH